MMTAEAGKREGSGEVYVVWTSDPSGHARKGLGNNLARKCLEDWNAAVGVDEGKSARSANQRSSSLEL